MKKRKIARGKRFDPSNAASHVKALHEAIEICGGQSALAAAIARYMGNDCKISQATIWYWLNEGNFIDAKWWLAFEHVTDGKVTGARLRPDVFRRSSVLSNHIR